MIDKYTKYFIICIVFIGVLASISTFSYNPGVIKESEILNHQIIEV